MSKKAAPVKRPTYFTVPEAADEVRLSPDTVRRAIRAGKLRAKNSSDRGGKTLVRADALDAWFDGLPEA